ncbi:LexA family protein [Paenibacillus sp. FSL H7-0918]|uniref:LexA family protein n=1 Tax=Paenibacillus sp. FSL H7-0918 TaxID=2921442 RepID=UPI0030F8C890
MKPLTDKEKEILRSLIKMIEINHYPPTLRELAKEVGLSSTAVIHAHMERLEIKGYIQRGKNMPRALRVIKGVDDDNETTTA